MNWMDVLMALVLFGGLMVMSLGFMMAVRKIDKRSW